MCSLQAALVRVSQRFVAEAIALLGSRPLTPACQLALPSLPTTKARCGPKFWKSLNRRAASAFNPGVAGEVPDWGSGWAVAAPARLITSAAIATFETFMR